MKKYGQLNRYILLLLSLVTVLSLLGCAQLPTAGTSANDLRTDSDDSLVRQKAKKRLELALAYFQADKFLFALDNVKLAIQDDPSYLDAYDLRGLIYMRMEQPKFADASFKEALSMDRHNDNVLNNYGWFLCQQRRYGEALKYLAEALADPKSPSRLKALTNMGICQMRVGNLLEAEKNLLEAYRLTPQNLYISYSLAQLYWQKKEYGHAEKYIRNVNNSDVATPESLWLGIKIERANGNPTAMHQLGENLSRRFPNSVQAKYWSEGAFDE